VPVFIIRYVQALRYEIILVDNGSGEFNSANTAPWGEVVRLVVSDKNLGFAGGNNLGIAHASGKYILLLNSDTYLRENAVLKTFRYMEAHPEVGALSCRLIYPDGTVQSAAQRFPSIRYGLVELLRLQKLMSKKTAGKLLLGAFFDHQETVKADWVWGTYFMFPRKVLEDLPSGKLDDTFFMYGEDMQWCMDLRKAGYEVHFYGETEVVHLLSRSPIDKASSSGKIAFMARNHEIFMKRHFGPVHRGAIRMIERLLRISARAPQEKNAVNS
jgi:GT2 family glycosyltransferase